MKPEDAEIKRATEDRRCSLMNTVRWESGCGLEASRIKQEAGGPLPLLGVRFCGDGPPPRPRRVSPGEGHGLLSSLASRNNFWFAWFAPLADFVHPKAVVFSQRTL